MRLSLFMLAAAILICAGGAALPEEASAPAGPNTAVPSDEEAVVIEGVEGVRKTWEEAYSLEEGRPFSVTFTEEQVQDQITLRLQEDSPVSDVSIDFRPSDTVVSAFMLELENRPVSVAGEIIFTMQVSEGELVITAEDATVETATGRTIDVPPAVLDTLNEGLASALTGSDQGDATLSAVVITEESVTIEGTVSR